MEKNNKVYSTYSQGKGYGVMDAVGNIIVPFGKYAWIDKYDHGLARFRISETVDPESGWGIETYWGILNEKGEEVLPPIYDEIWNFYGKNRTSTKVKKDGVYSYVFFHDLNPNLPAPTPISPYGTSDDYYADNNGRHYEEFAGSYAQDIMGFSDEDIYDAFEGDPDAYWNID